MVLMAAAILSSCGTLHKTTHSETKVKTSSSDSSTVKVKKSDSSAINRVIKREKADTTIPIKGSDQDGSKSLEELKRGDSLVLDDEDQRVVVDYDPTTGRIEAKGKVKDRNERIQVDKEVIFENAVDVKREELDGTHVAKSDSDSSSATDKTVKARIGPDWAMWAGLFIALGFGLLAFVGFYKLKSKSPF